MPAEIRLSTVGITVFASALDFPPVPEWQLQDVAMDAAIRALSPRFQIVDRQALTQFVDAKGRPEDKPDGTSEIQQFARNRAKGGIQADLIVVITRNPLDILYPNAQAPRDIDISKQLLPFFPQPPVAHAYTYVTILDGKTFAVISESDAFVSPIPESYNAVGAEGNFPYAKLDIGDWHDHWSNWSPEQKAMARDKILDLLSMSITFTLQKMLSATGS